MVCPRGLPAASEETVDGGGGHRGARHTSWDSKRHEMVGGGGLGGRRGVKRKFWRCLVEVWQKFGRSLAQVWLVLCF